jgi:hypothetical protein
MNKFTWIAMALTLAGYAGSAHAADVVDCTVTEAQGAFDSYIPPKAGDTLQLDLTEAPRLKFERHDGSGLKMSYIPVEQPWRDESSASCTRWVAGDDYMVLEVTRDLGRRLTIVVTQTFEDDPHMTPGKLVMDCRR